MSLQPNQANTLLLAQLRDAQLEAARATRQIVALGGMTALLHPSSSLCWLNPTIPTGDVDLAFLPDIERFYLDRDRPPFFEFAEELAPDLSVALRARGYEEVLRANLLIYDRRRPVPSSTALLSTEADLSEGHGVASIAFGDPSQPWSEIEENVLRGFRSGSFLSAHTKDGDRIVSVGQAVGTIRVREIAGLATLPEFRRRGHCGAVVNRLLAAFFEGGGEIAWIVPGHEAAESLYRGLGFQTGGASVAYLKPAPAP